MNQPTLSIYHDGSCPLCRLEIDHYKRQSGAEHLTFVDVSIAEANAGPQLDQRAALSRFHVRLPNGDLRSGAAAFVEVWDRLPRWRWLARFARMPGALAVLETGYVLFLPLRPFLARLAGRFNSR